MNRIVKIFCPAAERDQLAGDCRIIEHYDAFALVEVSGAKVKPLARKFPVEDITDLYRIHAGDLEINTARPRVDTQGKVKAHPAYRGVKPLSKGPHHYLVQFIGPIK